MEVSIDWGTAKADDLVAGVMPHIESHLQMAWAQTEWVDRSAVGRLDRPLQGFVASLLAESGQVSAGDVVRALRGGLEDYFERSIAEGDFVADRVMGPIVERFAVALNQLADAATVVGQKDRETLVARAYEGIDHELEAVAKAPQNFDKETLHRLHTFIIEAVENADDASVVSTYLRDRVYNLCESLRGHSQGAGGAISGLDQLLQDAILAER